MGMDFRASRVADSIMDSPTDTTPPPIRSHHEQTGVLRTRSNNRRAYHCRQCRSRKLERLLRRQNARIGSC
jgi:hypothetical protein